MGRDDRPLLLLYGSGAAPYRRYILDSVARRYALWLFAHDEPTWQVPYLAGHTVVETLSSEAAIEAARALARARPVEGVLCYDEVRVHLAATVAADLGLPTSAPDAVVACRDKHLSRERMAAGDVPQATSIAVGSLDEALAAAERIGYPVIVKPRALAGSLGVELVEGPASLPAKFAAANAAHFDEVAPFDKGILVEEYLDGPEISVDCVVLDGEVTPVCLARKETDLAPTFEETGHVVDAGDPLLRDGRVLDVLRLAHKAIGFTRGVTHTELRLTRTGGPKVVELNGRLGGDLIPYVGWVANGVDLAMATADLSAGHRPDTNPTRRMTAAIRFYYPPADMVAARVDVHATRLPAMVWEAAPLARLGAPLLLPPRSYVSCRTAYAIAVGTDAVHCGASLDQAGEAVEVIPADADVGA